MQFNNSNEQYLYKSLINNVEYSNESFAIDNINISQINWLFNKSDTTEIPYVPYVLRPETYIVPTLFAIIFLIGVLGNGILILVFLTVRQIRNVPNT